MNTTSYWIDSASIKQFPKVTRDLQVDVLVVGAGIAGISTAYLMKEAGRKVALIDRDGLAMIDTGHTTAHLTAVTDEYLGTLVDDFGREHAAAAWDAGFAAIDEIQRIVRKEGIDCEFTRAPAYVHMRTDGDPEKERPTLQEEAKIASDLGFDAVFLESIPYFNVPGVRYANQAKFHPRKYLRGVLEKIPGDNSHVFQESEAGEFDAERQRLQVNGHWISFDRVVIATHNPILGFAGMAWATIFQTKLALYSTYAIGAQIPKGAVPQAMYWDTRDPYDYLRIEQYEDFDYAIYGGEDHKTGQVEATENRYQALVTRLKAAIPEARVDHRWSGQVIETVDGLPYIGENADGQFIATGFAGQGMTFSTVSAMMARDWATGRKNPWSHLFDPERKNLKAAAWDYMVENKDYPYYLVKDRIARAEADSVRELETNCGMVIRTSGGKVAAYRDGDGKVTKVSAVCTHMGCIVHWNSAERTWDCPCHGSRFKPGGEVISGPAEAPLSPA